MSRLARASWIEIRIFSSDPPILKGRGSRGPRGSKFCSRRSLHKHPSSRLARASWIEMKKRAPVSAPILVEAREGLVDRNMKFYHKILIKECRGSRGPRGSKSTQIAFKRYYRRRGSRGPRGSKSPTLVTLMTQSKSRLARASWIEINRIYCINGGCCRGSRGPRGSK